MQSTQGVSNDRRVDITQLGRPRSSVGTAARQRPRSGRGSAVLVSDIGILQKRFIRFVDEFLDAEPFLNLPVAMLQDGNNVVGMQPALHGW